MNTFFFSIFFKSHNNKRFLIWCFAPLVHFIAVCRAICGTMSCVLTRTIVYNVVTIHAVRPAWFQLQLCAYPQLAFHAALPHARTCFLSVIWNLLHVRALCVRTCTPATTIDWTNYFRSESERKFCMCPFIPIRSKIERVLPGPEANPFNKIHGNSVRSFLHYPAKYQTNKVKIEPPWQRSLT